MEVSTVPPQRTAIRWHMPCFIITPQQQMRSVWLGWEMRSESLAPASVCFHPVLWATSCLQIHPDKETVIISLYQTFDCTDLLPSRNPHLCLKYLLLCLYIFGILHYVNNEAPTIVSNISAIPHPPADHVQWLRGGLINDFWLDTNKHFCYVCANWDRKTV